MKHEEVPKYGVKKITGVNQKISGGFFDSEYVPKHGGK